MSFTISFFSLYFEKQNKTTTSFHMSILNITFTDKSWLLKLVNEVKFNVVQLLGNEWQRYVYNVLTA